MARLHGPASWPGFMARQVFVPLLGLVAVGGQQQQQQHCIPCPPGYGLVAASSVCVACAPGERSLAGRCETCASGKVAVENGTHCEFCPPGTEPVSNRSACVRCPAGEFSDLVGTCSPCPDGMVPDVATHSVCIYCPPGSERSANRSLCTRCPAGKHSSLEANCAPCGKPRNVTNSATGLLETVYTNEGMVPNGDQTVCEYCPPGEQPGFDNAHCETCPAGNYSNLQGYCRACPSGKIPNDNRTGCEFCEDGKAPSYRENGVCDLCPRGRYAKHGTDCTMCADGYHSVSSGSGECVLCPLGQVTNADRTACVCAPGYFDVALYPRLGVPACRAGGVCQIDEARLQVACFKDSWHQQCVRGPRNVSDLAPRTCFRCSDVPCPDGGRPGSCVTCPGGLETRRPLLWPREGFWLVDRDAPDAPTMVKELVVACMPSKVCPGVPTAMDAAGSDDGGAACVVEPGQCCRRSHYGPACGLCRDGYIKMSDKLCAKCARSNYAAVGAVMVAFGFLAVFLDFKARELRVEEDGAALGILTFFFQSVALFAEHTGSNAYYGALTGFSNLLNLDPMSSVQGADGERHCNFKLHPFQTFYVTIFAIPLYQYVCVRLVSFAVERRRRQRDMEKIEGTATAGLLAAAEASFKLKSGDEVDDGRSGDSGAGGLESESANDTPGAVKLLRRVRAWAAEKYDSSHLRFLLIERGCVPDHYAVDETEEQRALRLWWQVSTLALKRKQSEKHLHRVQLELAMFIYMGIAKAVTLVLFCRQIGANSYATLDIAVECGSGEHWVARVFAGFFLIVFTLGLPLYILFRMDALHTLDKGWKPGRFTTMVRMSYVFDEQHRGWNAFLLVRRFILVACSLIGHTYMDRIPVGDGRMDWRVMPFLVLVSYVMIQAWQNPFAIKEDNVLEQSTLCMLLIMLYSDVTLSGEAMEMSDGKSGLNFPIAMGAILFVVLLYLSQHRARMMRKRAQQTVGGLTIAGQALDSTSSVGAGPGGPATTVGRATGSLWLAATGNKDVAEAKRKQRQEVGGLTGALDAKQLSSFSSELKLTSSRVPGSLMDEDRAELRRKIGISDREITTYWKMFDAFDTDQSGTLTAQELIKLFELTGMRLTEESAAQIMRDVDEDESGEIDFAEFMQVIIRHRRQTDASEELEEAFKIFIQKYVFAEFFDMESDEMQAINEDMLRNQLHRTGLAGQGTSISSEAEIRNVLDQMMAVAWRFAPESATDIAVHNPMNDGDPDQPREIKMEAYKNMMMAFGTAGAAAKDTMKIMELERKVYQAGKKDSDGANEEEEQADAVAERPTRGRKRAVTAFVG
jgi:hypothetical protein